MGPHRAKAEKILAHLRGRLGALVRLVAVLLAKRPSRRGDRFCLCNFFAFRKDAGGGATFVLGGLRSEESCVGQTLLCLRGRNNCAQDEQ